MLRKIFHLSSLCLLLVLISTSINSQQVYSRPIKKGTTAFVTEFREPYAEMLVDIGENDFIETENLVLPIIGSTRIIDKKGRPLDRHMVRPGMEIKITGDRFDDRIQVSNIEVVTDIENWKVEVQGYFESLDGEKAWIGGQAVKLTPGAVIRGKDDLKGKVYSSFNEMQLGFQLKMEGVRRADGIVYIKKGEAERNDFTNGDKRMAELVAAGMLLPKRLEGGIGKVAGREVKFANDFELQAYVTRIGNKLVPRYEKDLPVDLPGKRVYRFAVIEDDSFNAFALPDGSVFIHTGLLKQIKTEAQLAAIIGHEIAHVTHEHSRKRSEDKKGFLIGLGMILGGGVLGGQAGAQIGMISAQALNNKYGRDAEDQADRVSLYYLTQAGYDPREGPKVWREISKNTKQDRLSNFLHSDHSMARDRLKNLNREIAYNYYGVNFAGAKVGDSEYKNAVRRYLNNSGPAGVQPPPPGSTPLVGRSGPATVNAQPTTANKAWGPFWGKFSSAIKNNNRAALRGMVSNDFFDGGGGGTGSEWIKFMDERKLWQEHRRSVALGTKTYKLDKNPGRVTKNDHLIFEFKAGRWWWWGIMGD